MVISIFRRAMHMRLGCIALSLVALAVMALPVRIATRAEAKTPGSTYCYHGICHRVKTIEETRSLVGLQQSIEASHYDDCTRDRYNPCGLTSSGERFRPDRPDNTASPIYPDGTTLLVWNPETKHALVVRVNNAGPYHGNRKLDLSVAAAEKLGFKDKGVAKLRVKVVKAPEPEEAKYSKLRNYAHVPGDIGEYSSVDEAEKGMAVAYALQASATSLMAPLTSRVFSMPSHEYLVAEAPQARNLAPTKLAAVIEPKTSLAVLIEEHDSKEVARARNHSERAGRRNRHCGCNRECHRRRAADASCGCHCIGRPQDAARHARVEQEDAHPLHPEQKAQEACGVAPVAVAQQEDRPSARCGARQTGADCLPPAERTEAL